MWSFFSCDLVKIGMAWWSRQHFGKINADQMLVIYFRICCPHCAAFFPHENKNKKTTEKSTIYSLKKENIISISSNYVLKIYIVFFFCCFDLPLHSGKIFLPFCAQLSSGISDLCMSIMPRVREGSLLLLTMIWWNLLPRWASRYFIKVTGYHIS